MKHISRYILTLVALFAISTGAWAGESTYYVVGNFTNWETSDANKMTWDDTANEYTLTLDVPAGAMFKVVGIYNQTQDWYPDGGGNAYGENGELPGAGKYTVHFDPNGGVEGWFAGYFKVDIVPGSVIINDNQTEASFEMPGNDVTVSYELVRDMGNQVELTVNGKQASAQNTPNIQVKKQGDAYPAASTLVVALTDLLEGKTAIESTNYTWALQRLAADGQTWQDLVVSNATLTPGAYNIVAKAKDGTLYDGSINAKFNVIEGYQVTVAPGEYATLFVKEAVVVDEGSTDAVLYTISSVTDTEAVLSEAIKVAPAETPLLVYNKGDKEQNFILFPTENKADEVTVAKEYRGTLTALSMPASSATVDYYVCTGSAFMWVRDAGVIAANRCWLQIGEQPAASRAKTRSIVGGGDTTSLRGVNSEVVNSEDYYDLQGRKVAKPTRGGIYIHNGKKVIKH